MDMLSSSQKTFLKENWELLDADNLQELYKRALRSPLVVCIGRDITDVFLQAGINPLEFLEQVPPFYLDSSNVTELVIPTKVQEAGVGAFAFSSLRNIRLHDNFKLSRGCFRMSEIAEVVVPDIMNEIPRECFYGSEGLQHVDLNSIEQIHEDAFVGCKSLTQLFIPDNINFIAPHVFYGCSNLTLHVHADNDYAIYYASTFKINYKVIT